MRRWKQRLGDARLLDHLIGRRQQRFRDGEAEGLGGLDVDGQLDFYYPQPAATKSTKQLIYSHLTGQQRS
jgi:hypothetical protein